MNKKYMVPLTQEARRMLPRLLSSGNASAESPPRLKFCCKPDSGQAGAGCTDERACEASGVGVSTVDRVRKRLAQETLQATLLPRNFCRAYPRKLDGDGDAHLISLAL